MRVHEASLTAGLEPPERGGSARKADCRMGRQEPDRSARPSTTQPVCLGARDAVCRGHLNARRYPDRLAGSSGQHRPRPVRRGPVAGPARRAGVLRSGFADDQTRGASVRSRETRPVDQETRQCPPGEEADWASTSTGLRSAAAMGCAPGSALRHHNVLSITMCPRQDSNLRAWLRRPPLYPLSYGGSGDPRVAAQRPFPETRPLLAGAAPIGAPGDAKTPGPTATTAGAGTRCASWPGPADPGDHIVGRGPIPSGGTSIAHASGHRHTGQLQRDVPADDHGSHGVIGRRLGIDDCQRHTGLHRHRAQ